MNVAAILFDGFETLDVFGPVEMLGASGEFEASFYSPKGGIVKSYQGVPVDTQPLSDVGVPEVLFVPGGMGVYDMLESAAFIERLARKRIIALERVALHELDAHVAGAFGYAKLFGLHVRFLNDR